MRGQRHASAAPYPQERHGTLCTGGWVGLRVGLDWCGKSRPTGIRSPDRPARRQSLYRLSYPTHIWRFIFLLIYINLDRVLQLKSCLEHTYTGRHNCMHKHRATQLYAQTHLTLKSCIFPTPLFVCFIRFSHYTDIIQNSTGSLAFIMKNLRVLCEVGNSIYSYIVYGQI